MGDGVTVFYCREHPVAGRGRTGHVLVSEPSHLPVAPRRPRHAAVLQLRAWTREGCSLDT
eukprot:scaffold71583_cov54-Phaeocystis_antarctica.AAC.6